MYAILILFFVSLSGIIFMISRKLTLVRNGTVVKIDVIHPFTPDIQKVKEIVVRETKRGIYAMLVAILRFYVRSVNFFKQIYQRVGALIRENWIKNASNFFEGEASKMEENKFLKVISDYKHKIKHIKHQVTEEENKFK